MTSFIPDEGEPSVPFKIKELQPSLGAEISGIDLGQKLTRETRDALRASLLKYRVLFFRDQDITREQQIALGEEFGELEIHPVFAVPEYPQLLPIVSSGIAGKDRSSPDVDWHADTTFRPAPSTASILRAIETPEIGGDTVFANAVMAYECLPSEVKQRVHNLKAFHNPAIFLRSIPSHAHDAFLEENPGFEHPVIRVHPETGEKAIYVNSIFTRKILGVPEQESEELLRILFDQIKRPEFQVRWTWKPNSIA